MTTLNGPHIVYLMLEHAEEIIFMATITYILPTTQSMGVCDCKRYAKSEVSKER